MAVQESVRLPVVLTRSVDPGNAVAASLQAVTLFTVAEDLSKLRLWVYVDEADVGAVQVGQSATFTVSAFLARKFPARITRVGFGSTITDNVVTYLTYLDVDNADLSLRPGMTATATIIASQRSDVLLVPNSALRFTPTAAGDGQAAAKGGIVASLIPSRPRSNTRKSAAAGASTAAARQVWVFIEVSGSIEKASGPPAATSSARISLRPRRAATWRRPCASSSSPMVAGAGSRRSSASATPVMSRRSSMASMRAGHSGWPAPMSCRRQSGCTK